MVLQNTTTPANVNISSINNNNSSSEQLQAVLGPLWVVSGACGLTWCSLIARFFDVAVLRPVWTSKNLPYENVFYVLFSVGVADVLHSGCALTDGLHLLLGLPCIIHKLQHLVLILARSCRVLLLHWLCIRLLLDCQWSSTFKVSLIYIHWLILVVASFLLCHNTSADKLDFINQQWSLPVSLWRYVMIEVIGMALAPLSLLVLYRGSTPLSLNSEHQQNEHVVNLEPADTDDVLETANKPVSAADALRHAADLKRIAYLTAWDALRSSARPTTASRFTVSNMWSANTEDVQSEALEYSTRPTPRHVSAADVNHRHCISVVELRQIRRRAHQLVGLYGLVQALFSCLSCAAHVIGDSETPLPTSALLIEHITGLQPLCNAIVFTAILSGFCKLIVLDYRKLCVRGVPTGSHSP